MPAWEALQSFVSLLKALPPALVAQDHIGLRRPSAAADLPRVVVSVADVEDLQAGIGGIVGSRQLSSTSWTSETGLLSSGKFTIELWAEDETALVNLATGVFGVLEDSAAAAGAGFDRLAARAVGPITLTTLAGLQPGEATGLQFPVSGTFSVEAVTPVQTGPGGIIKQVQVDVREFGTTGVDETMGIP